MNSASKVYSKSITVFCGSVRLAKRWISSQLLTDHVPDIAVELIVAYLYTSAPPYTVPSNPLTGFLRFLNLLSTHDWKVAPLILNLNAEFKDEDYTQIQSKFTKTRSSLPLMFISTPQDKFQSIWTRKQPTPMILQRLVALAKECLDVLESQLSSTGLSSANFKQVFRPPLDGFHMFHLKGKQITRQLMMIDRPKFVYNPLFGDELEEDQKKCLPVYDFDPVEKYLQEIRVNHMFSRRPETSENGQTEVVLKLNLEAIIEDFKLLGGGLVSSVQNCNL